VTVIASQEWLSLFLFLQKPSTNKTYHKFPYRTKLVADLW
jgi:hypothetical protein